MARQGVEALVMAFLHRKCDNPKLIILLGNLSFGEPAMFRMSIAGTLIAFLLVITVHGDDWPQFRGPNCSGISLSQAKLPTQFSATENVSWQISLGDGVGSPVVVAGRVFVSSMIDENHVGLHAYDAATGESLWTRSWETAKMAEVHKTNSHSATTPAADESRVYFYFSTLGLIAVDAETGNDVWNYKMPVPFFVFKWGPAMSPVLHKDKVIFCQDDDLYPAMIALDKATGNVLWKDDRNDQAVNYSHPVIVSTTNGDELVVAGTGMLVGYNPDTGKRLWYARVLLRNIKTTPVVADNTIYVSLQSGGIANQWLATADQNETGNNDGKLSKEEIQAFVGVQTIPAAFYKKTFGRGDTNQDGLLEGEELDKAFLHPDNFAGARYDAAEAADEYVLAVKAGGKGDVTDSHLLWKQSTKYTDHIVSPHVSNGRILLIKGGGIRTVFSTSEGKSIESQKRIQNSGEYFASPVAGDGKIYIAGENGTVVVLNDSDDYEILAKNDMGDAIVATPAIADGRIFIRTRLNLICVTN